MAVDPNRIAPVEKARLIRIGAGFGTADAQAQADITINAATEKLSLIRGHGFAEAKLVMLTEIRELSRTASVDREGARTDRKVTNAALLDATRAGKAARLRVRSNLEGARGDLAMFGGAAALPAVNAIDAALASTRTAGADAKALGEQLQQLHDLLAHATVRAAVGEEAGTLETELATCVTALEVARSANASARGTRTETEWIDLLDGLLVELVRAARRAARSAAKALGQPALADEFELNALYASTGRRTPSTPPPV
jgi:hypothetical protein